jgi:hypothetical protein
MCAQELGAQLGRRRKLKASQMRLAGAERREQSFPLAQIGRTPRDTFFAR